MIDLFWVAVWFIIWTIGALWLIWRRNKKNEST